MPRCHRMSKVIGGYEKEGYEIRDLIGGGMNLIFGDLKFDRGGGMKIGV